MTANEKQRILSLAIDLWRKSLVSFDGNNRQIFYKYKKVGDVKFDDSYVDRDVLEKLMAGGKIRVSALYLSLVTKINAKIAKDVSGLDLAFDEDEESEAKEKDLAKLWAYRLRRFEAVYRKTKEDNEERNIDTCFVAEGFASWQPKQSGTTVPNAPLLLHQIKIESVSKGNSDFGLEKTGPTILNEALCLYLETEFGIAPEIFEIGTDDLRLHSSEINSLVAKIQEIVPGFRVNQDKVLGNFAFAHYPMFIDLKRILRQGTSHPVLAALAGMGTAISELGSSGSEEELEELAVKNPLFEHLVFPADSSQHAAISAIMGGKNVVIQGPPGTGKSQTIANVIAECAANKKSVLFVAEKRAAIDAVVERLADKGLQGIILDLHGEPNKKTIAKNLTEVLKTHEISREMTSADTIRLLNNKKILQSRWDWMHQPIELLNLHGEKMQVMELFRQVGIKRAQIDRKILDDGFNYLNQLERIDTVARELIADRFDILYRSGYFASKKSDGLIDEFAALIKTESQSHDLVKQIMNLQSLVKTREFQSSHSIANRLVPSTVPSLEGISSTLSKYVMATSSVTEWDIEKYSEILDFLPAFGTLNSYRKFRSLGIIKAYFERKKELQSIHLFRHDKDLNLSRDSLCKSILNLENAITAWERIGGKLADLVSRDFAIDRYREVVEQSLELAKQIDKFPISVKIAGSELSVALTTIDQLSRNLEYIRELPRVNEALGVIRDYSLTGVLELFEEKSIEQSQAGLYWDYLWHSANLRNVLATTNQTVFSSTSLNDAVREFHSKDSQHFVANPGRIIRSITSSHVSADSPGRQLLRRESAKKAGHLPFRELISKIPDEIKAIKPCFAMSPLAVSKLLPSVEGMFDIVIFDEASQIKPENAITAIYRGKQLVVAGDRHQLPPTSVGVGGTTLIPNSADEDEFSNPNLQTQDMESILDAVASIFPANDSHIKPLRLHYRSNDEKLISWSNFHIYREAGEELSSFPSTSTDSRNVLRHTYIPGVRIQSMSRANEVEIQEVIRLVKKHISNEPELSLGVIAFGSRHAIRLQDAFNVLEKEEPDFYLWKSEWNSKREKFFVKNIERVQGDERDAIIITPGYAPNLEGNVPLQFGTLNNSGGERRLNVAASRAKKSLHLVTSLKSTDIDTNRSKSRSIALFKSFLNFMENTGRLEELPGGYAVPESPFEEEIYAALTKEGLLIDCQVGDSKYKIDFGVRHPETSKYVLAIEADGWTYHSQPYARERDWLRQDVLERKGWSFVRIWSTDWWENSAFEIKRVMDAYHKAMADVPSISPNLPFLAEALTNSNHENVENNVEYDVLRGLIAQFPNMLDEELIRNWKRILNLQRVSPKLRARFVEYSRRIKRELR